MDEFADLGMSLKFVMAVLESFCWRGDEFFGISSLDA